MAWPSSALAQQEWRQTAKLTAKDGDSVDFFGSVAVSENTMVIGALQKEKLGTDQSPGGAYVFTRNGDEWTQQGPALFAAGTPGFDQFGAATAIAGDTIAVGAPYKDINGNDFRGAAYVFSRSGNQWLQQGALLASDGADGDFFGYEVALGADTLLVGASNKKLGDNALQGAAYVFTRTSNKWSQQGPPLTASDGAKMDQFGAGLAIAGDTAFIGAPGKHVGANDKQGAVYVFRRSAGVWTQQGAPLLASDGAAEDWFGFAITVQNDTLAIGAYNKTLSGHVGQGAVYVFTRSGDDWTQQGPALTASDGAAGDWFGLSVALRGDVLAVGAGQQDIDGTVDQGGGYVFTRSEGVWTQQGGRLTSSDGAEDDWFGHYVGLSDGMAIFGATFHDVGNQIAQGAAYVFKLGDEIGSECSSGATCSSSQCVDGVCCESSCSGACDACSIGAGSQQDGACQPVAGGSAGVPDCGALICDGVHHDCSGCVHDSDCGDDQFCNASHECESQRAQGAECHPLANADCSEAGCDICQSGQCVDEVCCETACQDTCMACSQAHTGLPDGSCSAVLKNTDPHDDCDASEDACGHDGQCDGSGACQFPKLGTPCGNNSCQGDSVAGLVCDGAGICQQTEAIPCAPYVCNSGSCTNPCTSDADCQTRAFCSEGQCRFKLVDGLLCTTKNQCASGFCVDGVCCDSACDGECESCSSGACLPQPPGDCSHEGGAGGAGTGDGGAPVGSDAGGASSAGTPTDAGTSNAGGHAGGGNAGGSGTGSSGKAGSAPQGEAGEGSCSGDECVDDWPMTSDTRDSSGCGCRMRATSSSGLLSPLAALALAIGLRRRRR